MKKLINNPENVLNDMLCGLEVAYPDYLGKLYNFNVIMRRNKAENKVEVMSYGGSGHEPAYAGYVGYGMLDAGVCGEVLLV